MNLLWAITSLRVLPEFLWWKGFQIKRLLICMELMCGFAMCTLIMSLSTWSNMTANSFEWLPALLACRLENWFVFPKVLSQIRWFSSAYNPSFTHLSPKRVLGENLNQGEYWYILKATISSTFCISWMIMLQAPRGNSGPKNSRKMVAWLWHNSSVFSQLQVFALECLNPGLSHANPALWFSWLFFTSVGTLTRKLGTEFTCNCLPAPVNDSDTVFQISFSTTGTKIFFHNARNRIKYISGRYFLSSTAYIVNSKHGPQGGGAAGSAYVLWLVLK